MTTKKSTALLALGLFAAATGCSSPYDITLRDHNTITVIGKPVYDKANEVYHFKDAKGKSHVIAAVRISVIEPHKKPPKPSAPTPSQWTRPQ
jgi:hypothetical protein